MALVKSIKERCRTCYTCVRECPAKAIRIYQGQADVVSERCIGCGNCLQVCSQNAKEILNSVPDVLSLFNRGLTTAVVLAPSFPVEFQDIPYPRLVGMLRKAGFDTVHEVAFGADLLSRAYRKRFQNNREERVIASTCAALVAYVEYYHPELVPVLAPLVSPTVAISRVLKRLLGEHIHVVFIGPCIAKKGEIRHHEVKGEVEAVLTFQELRTLFQHRGVTPDSAQDSDFDPPHPAKGMLFAMVRGLLEAADLKDDPLSEDIRVAHGKPLFIEAIREFNAPENRTRLLEVLCCDGCIMGAGIRKDIPLYLRRKAVSQYVQERLTRLDGTGHEALMAQFSDLDLSRSFSVYDRRIVEPNSEELAAILRQLGRLSPDDELNCGACGYETCRAHGMAIYRGLAENEMCLPNTIEALKTSISRLAESNMELATMENALNQSEKLASMGQLAAGIAHEVNNPLGVVLMYSHLLLEKYGGEPRLREDLTLIAEQADRCKRIISGLLNFARQNRINRRPVNLFNLLSQTIKTVNFGKAIQVTLKHNMNNPVADIDEDQISQALLNLLTNAQAAMSKGGELTIETEDTDESVRISVADSGVGIPKENASKIFNPFFTTKQIGKGTGLGLAVTYGIIKMHRGEIKFESNSNPSTGPTGTKFIISLPRHE
ncbi:MAG: histidine kinase [Elusimicrobia bacterium RIFOXYB2_FULL_49_7]|nr:MAG: histidine kinase [Elusimicrobia bacterium RIFOXYB2_FULL_49_7]